MTLTFHMFSFSVFSYQDLRSNPPVSKISWFTSEALPYSSEPDIKVLYSGRFVWLLGVPTEPRGRNHGLLVSLSLKYNLLFKPTPPQSCQKNIKRNSAIIRVGKNEISQRRERRSNHKNIWHLETAAFTQQRRQAFNTDVARKNERSQRRERRSNHKNIRHHEAPAFTQQRRQVLSMWQGPSVVFFISLPSFR